MPQTEFDKTAAATGSTVLAAIADLVGDRLAGDKHPDAYTEVHGLVRESDTDLSEVASAAGDELMARLGLEWD